MRNDTTLDVVCLLNQFHFSPVFQLNVLERKLTFVLRIKMRDLTFNKVEQQTQNALNNFFFFGI